MHKISALFNKPSRDGKYKESSDAGYYVPPHGYESSSDSSSSFGAHPRLIRSPVIRGLRQPDNVDLSGIYLNGTDHTTESNPGLPVVLSAPDLSSTLPPSFKMASPLPSPPRSPIGVTSQASILWPLPAPRQLPPKRTEDTGKNLNSISSDGLEDNHIYLPDGEMQKTLQSAENSQRFSSHLGISIPSSSRAGGMPANSGVGHTSHTGGLPSRTVKAGGGGDVHTHMHSKQVESSTSNDHLSSALRSPCKLGNQTDTWIWKHEQGVHGNHTSADEISSAEQSSMANYPYQNGTSSRDARHSRHHPTKLGTPTALSPPLSPSATRALSPGGWLKGHLLGSGAFGKVYKGIHSETGEFCAIKEVEFAENDHRSKESAMQLEKEIESLSILKHPNIVQYKGSEMVGDSLYIFLELISGGSLYKLYQEFKKLEEPVIRRYTRQILLGLRYLHARKFVHRDIKCANILVDQDGTIKLADFGVAKYIKEQGKPFSLRGSPHWMAPEVILSMNVGYEYAVDIWSLGCTVIEMVTGKPPWSDLEAAAAMFKVTKVGAPPIPESLSPDGQSFLRLCLQRNPADRPMAAALLEHPFVRIHNDAHHGAVRASDALNTLDPGGLRPQYPASSMYPSLSAPSSPQSSHRPVYELTPPQSNFASSPRYTEAGLLGAKLEQKRNFGNLPPLYGLGKPRKKGPSSFETRRSQEFTEARPSLSAPGSPQSSRSTYGGNFYPIPSGEILPGHSMPFFESIENPRCSSDFGQDFRRTYG